MRRFLLDTGPAADFVNRRQGVYDRAKQSTISERIRKDGFRRGQQMTRAGKGRRETVADEMLAGLQAFARDLKELPAAEIKDKYRQRTVEADFWGFGQIDIVSPAEL